MNGRSNHEVAAEPPLRLYPPGKSKKLFRGVLRFGFTLFLQAGFDDSGEELCRPFYREAGSAGWPGVYFVLLVGYFEAIGPGGSERGIAWQVADSLPLRAFAGRGLEEPTSDHSTLSRIRQRRLAEP